MADRQPETTVTQTADEVEELAGCMWQLLNDMGNDGLSVCAYAKAQARIAMEPFINDLIEAECLMPLAEAERIVRECNRMAQPDTTRDQERFAGFSSSELLRRARVLRDIAASDRKERRHLDQIAWEHEEAARLVRRKENAEDA